GLEQRDQRARRGAEDHHQPGRRLPHEQQQKRRYRQRKIGGAGDAHGPYRLVKRGQQQPHHRGIDAAQRGLRQRPPPQLSPERQRANDKEKRRQEDRDETDRRPDPAVRLGLHHRAEIGGEGEQRSRHGLRRAVAGEKRVVADPARRNDRRLQQRQHHMSAAEHQRTRAIERIEVLERLRGNRRCQQRQADEQREERRQQQRAERA